MSQKDESLTEGALRKRRSRLKLKDHVTVTIHLKPSLGAKLKELAKSSEKPLKVYVEDHLEDYFTQTNFLGDLGL